MRIFFYRTGEKGHFSFRELRNSSPLEGPQFKLMSKKPQPSDLFVLMQLQNASNKCNLERIPIGKELSKSIIYNKDYYFHHKS